ncbi:RNA 2',3'-cyclic phosphodiesterase [Protofrankia symbiont of Coriaria ruscifolia]|uniref:RNA 2',3'-cyclic phosphodiesterase n=1 Tax=Protofrankia symbiont of Coriaria ruscifolia TaxID=1306542 RepID=UPI00104137C7|nr:RNA 2',3'-cyclic phosphodiesterase [Protofrankia symbiont of Coriaria ruscifolia]
MQNLQDMARMFVALLPPKDVVEPLVGAVQRLRADQPRLAVAVRWAPPESWHITLAFLGEVPATVRPELAQQLAQVASEYPPVPVVIAGGGRFGTRVLFAAVDEPPLAPLARAVARAARNAGVIGLDSRVWRGHLTLATRRSSRPKGRHTGSPPQTGEPDLAPLVDGLAGITARPWTATGFTLMRSGPVAGPPYETTATWPLEG